MTCKIEHHIQCAFIEIARTIPGAEMIHAIPNAMPGNVVAQMWMNREGRSSGVLDVFNPKPVLIPSPRIAENWRFHGLYMETKRPAWVMNGKKKPAGTLTEEQAKFILYADSVGYAVAVYYSAQEGVDILQRYLLGEHSNRTAVELARKKLGK